MYNVNMPQGMQVMTPPNGNVSMQSYPSNYQAIQVPLNGYSPQYTQLQGGMNGINQQQQYAIVQSPNNCNSMMAVTLEPNQQAQMNQVPVIMQQQQQQPQHQQAVLQYQ